MLYHPSADHLEPTVQHQFNRLTVRFVFLLQNAGRERVFVIMAENGDSPLHDDRAVVEFFIHEVNSASGDFDAVRKRLLLGFKAGECRQQRWVDIQYSVWKLFNKPRRQQSHISRKTNQVNFV
jgi:hypothetical protein